MKKLFIIAGCNGAGKTTASYTILPEMLNCDEFVNADEVFIASSSGGVTETQTSGPITKTLMQGYEAKKEEYSTVL